MLAHCTLLVVQHTFISLHLLKLPRLVDPSGKLPTQGRFSITNLHTFASSHLQELLQLAYPDGIKLSFAQASKIGLHTYLSLRLQVLLQQAYPKGLYTTKPRVDTVAIEELELFKTSLQSLNSVEGIEELASKELVVGPKALVPNIIEVLATSFLKAIRLNRLAVLSIEEQEGNNLAVPDTKEQEEHNQAASSSKAMVDRMVLVVVQTQAVCSLAKQHMGAEVSFKKIHALLIYLLPMLTCQHKDCIFDGRGLGFLFSPRQLKRCIRSQTSHRYSYFSSELSLWNLRLAVIVSVPRPSHGTRDVSHCRQLLLGSFSLCYSAQPCIEFYSCRFLLDSPCTAISTRLFRTFKFYK